MNQLGEARRLARFASLIAATCWAVAGAASFAIAQEPTAQQDDAAALRWNGDHPVRVIGMFASQMAELIPEDFRPVSVKELNRALAAWESTLDASRARQIGKCEMVAVIEGETLRSDRSRFWCSPATAAQDDSVETSSGIGITGADRPVGGGDNDELEPANSRPIRWELGRLNMAIQPVEEPSAGAVPATVEVSPDGTCQLVAPYGTVAELTWSQEGRAAHGGTQWQIDLPESVEIRFWVAVPRGQKLTSPDAVVRRAQRSPSTAVAQNKEVNWYHVEASGGQRLTLSLSPLVANRLAVIREGRWQCQLRGGVLHWQCRLVMDAQPLGLLPDFQLAGGQVTRVQWEGQDVPFQARSVDGLETVTLRDFTTDRPRTSDDKATMTLGMTGYSLGSSPRLERIPLPNWVLPHDRFLIIPDLWQMRIALPEGVEVAEWSLGPDWRVRPRTETTWQAQGRESATRPDGLDSSDNLDAEPRPPEARWMRLAQEPPLWDADHQVRFLLDESTVEARGRIEVAMPEGHTSPIVLEVQGGFLIESMTVQSSQRSVPPPAIRPKVSEVLIWPTADEVVDDRVTLLLEGRAGRRAVAVNDPDGRPSRNEVGSLWFARVKDCPGRLTAAIIPPAAMSWTADTAIHPHRLDFADLSEQQRRFFAPLPGDAILFADALQATPHVSLETPDVSLAVSTRTVLKSDGDQVTQMVSVRPDDSLGSLESIRLRIPAVAATPFSQVTWFTQLTSTSRWIPVREERMTNATRPGNSALGGGSEQTRENGDRSAPDSRKDAPPADGDQDAERASLVEIRLPVPRGFTTQSRWIGRRTIPLNDRVKIGLPTVADASTQTGEVWIEPSLQLFEPDGAVVGGPAIMDGGPELMSRWRTTSTAPTVLTVGRRVRRPPRHFVRRQGLRMVASISGADLIEGRFEVHADSSVRLDFPAHLQLARIRVDGVDVPVEPIPGRGVWVPLLKSSSLRERLPKDADGTGDVASSPSDTGEPLAGTDGQSDVASREGGEDAGPASSAADRDLVRIDAIWHSQVPVPKPWRRVTWPAIGIDGLTLQSSFRMEPAEDTLRLTFWPWQESVAAALPLSDLSGTGRVRSSGLLVSAAWVQGIGWIASLLVLAAGWGLHRRRSAGVVVLWAMVIFAAVAWPSASLPLMTFVCVPLALAGLGLATQKASEAIRVPRERPRSGRPWEVIDGGASPPAGDDAGSAPPASGAGGDGSAGASRHPGSTASGVGGSQFSAIGLRLVTGILLGAVTAEAIAQNPPAPSSVDLLVPLRADGEPLGDKVYVPEAFYDRLFAADTGRRAADVAIRRADYRLWIRPLQSSTLPGISATGTTATEKERWVRAIDLEVDLRVATARPSRRLKLPFSAEVVESVSLRRPDGTLRALRLAAPASAPDLPEMQPVPSDAEQKVVNAPPLEVEVPAAEQFDLVLRLRGDVTVEDGLVRFRAAVPPVPQATLAVRPNESVRALSLGTLQGAIGLRGQNRRAIGPVSAISIRFRWKDARQSPTVSDDVPTGDSMIDPTTASSQGGLPESQTQPWISPVQWDRRDWVHVASHSTVIQSELEPTEEIAENGLIRLQIEEGFSTPVLIGDGWQLTEPNGVGPPEKAPDGESEQSVADDSKTPIGNPPTKRPGRRSIVLQRRGDDALPIRLAWTLAPRPVLPQDLPTQQQDVTAQQQDVTAQRQEGVFAEDAAAGSGQRRHSLVVSPPNLQLFSGPDFPTGEAETLNRPEAPPEFRRVWIAWTIAENLDPVWSDTTGVAPLAIDDFYASWNGYLGPIDRAVAVEGDLPVLRVATAVAYDESVRTAHEIHLQNDSRRIRFTADFAAVGGTSLTETPSTGSRSGDAGARLPSTLAGSPHYAIDLPPGAEVLQWSVQRPGQPLLTPSSADRAGWTIVDRPEGVGFLLTTARQGTTVQIEAVVRSSRPDRPFALPLVTVRPLDLGGATSGANGATSEHQLTVTRTARTAVRWLDQPGGTPMDVTGDTAAWLGEGQMPVGAWVTSGTSSDAWGQPRLRVDPQDQTFDADTRIQLRWEEGRWTAVTTIRVTSPTVPDFLDVEMPTRWCESLAIEPLQASSRQPTLEPARQVIRIGLLKSPRSDQDPSPDSPHGPDDDADATHVRQVRLISRLAVTELVRVGVPKIRLLRCRRHRVDLVVPERLTNEPVNWRTSGVDPQNRLRWKLQTMSSPADETATTSGDDELGATDRQLLFAVENANWSIELESLPQSDVAASVLHADHQFLAMSDTQWLASQGRRSDGSRREYAGLLVSRFDLVPGDASELTLQLPGGAVLVGAWVGGQSANVIASETPASDELPKITRGDETEPSPGDEIGERLRFLLPISRLSQSVELLVQTQATEGQLALPELLGLQSPPATISWCDEVSTRPTRPPKRVQDSATSTTNGEALQMSPELRYQWLASSTVKAIAVSSDSLADRSDEEVSAWLQPWIRRYVRLCHAADRRMASDDVESESRTLSAEQASQWITETPGPLPWPAMDRFVTFQSRRYLLDSTVDDPMPATAPASNWARWLSVAPPTTHRSRAIWRTDEGIISMSRLPDPPVAFAVSPTLRGHLVRVLLAFVGLSMMTVWWWPHRRAASPQAPNETRSGGPRWNWTGLFETPAFWLFVLGLCGLLLVPAPIAVALMAVAVVLGGFDPAWNRVRRWVRRPDSETPGLMAHQTAGSSKIRRAE